LKPFQLAALDKDHRNWSRLAFGVVISLLWPAFIFAEDQITGIETKHRAGAEQIQIVADKLIANDVEKYAEFIGDVKTTYLNFVIVSDSLKIYYKNNLPGPNKNRPDNPEMIQRMVANGNVTITTDKYTAETQSAEYDMDTMILVLSGENSIVRSGENILSGSKITIYRKDGKIKVDGSPQKRVKAVFYSDKIPENQQW
jgi:lipopolysaccharide export system protein LptA